MSCRPLMPLPQNQVNFCLQSNVVDVTDFAFKCFLSYGFFLHFILLWVLVSMGLQITS